MQRLEQYDAYAIPVEDILCDDEFNCRGWFTKESVEELANDIKSNGLLVPIVIQPWTEPPFRCLAGHRRLLAHMLNGERTVAAYIKSNLTERQAKLLNFTENLQREDLNMLQEAKTLRVLYPENTSYTAMKKETGKNMMWLRTRWLLLDLPDEIQQCAAARSLTENDLRRILQKHNPDEQIAICKKLIDAKKTGRLPKQFKRSTRSKEQISRMQIEFLVAGIKGLAVEALSWCAGEMVDGDLLDKIEKAKKHRIRSRPHGRIENNS